MEKLIFKSKTKVFIVKKFIREDSVKNFKLIPKKQLKVRANYITIIK
jgi:hypothetical protein